SSVCDFVLWVLFLTAVFTAPPLRLHDPAPTQISTLSLHDALPISERAATSSALRALALRAPSGLPSYSAPSASADSSSATRASRSEEHTSELQSRENLVCRLLLEKKKRQT